MKEMQLSHQLHEMPDVTAAQKSKLCALDVVARTRIDAERIAFVDEERHADFVARLDLGNLRSARRRVALDARLALDDLEVDGIRQLDADDAAFERLQRDFHVLHEVVQRIAELLLVEAPSARTSPCP